MAKKNNGRDRTAIWSVRTKWRNVYFGLFHTQLVWILVSSIWSYFGTPPAWITIYQEIVGSMSNQIIVHAAYTLFFTEAYRMLSDAFEQWLKRSQKEKGIVIGKEIGIEQGKEIGIEIGIERGIERGMERGMEQGMEQERSQWRAWNMRRELAQSEGREFNEPPPNGQDSG